MEAIHRQKAEKQREKAIADQFEARRSKNKQARERKKERREDRLTSVSLLNIWSMHHWGGIDVKVGICCVSYQYEVIFAAAVLHRLLLSNSVLGSHKFRLIVPAVECHCNVYKPYNVCTHCVLLCCSLLCAMRTWMLAVLAAETACCLICCWGRLTLTEVWFAGCHCERGAGQKGGTSQEAGGSQACQEVIGPPCTIAALFS